MNEIWGDNIVSEYRDVCLGNFIRMFYGVLDLGFFGYRNDYKKKVDRFLCRKNDFFFEFYVWKNIYLKEEKGDI